MKIIFLRCHRHGRIFFNLHFEVTIDEQHTIVKPFFWWPFYIKPCAKGSKVRPQWLKLQVIAFNIHSFMFFELALCWFICCVYDNSEAVIMYCHVNLQQQVKFQIPKKATGKWENIFSLFLEPQPRFEPAHFSHKSTALPSDPSDPLFKNLKLQVEKNELNWTLWSKWGEERDWYYGQWKASKTK